FQAEDGIRDFHVTGVQTCALPIFAPSRIATARPRMIAPAAPPRAPLQVLPGEIDGASFGPPKARPTKYAAISVVQTTANKKSVRSEERRVGKECRSQRSQTHVAHT